MAKRILIVDDDPSVIEVLDLLLTSEGYEVIKASDGEQGLRYAKSENPDAMILDVKMPKLSGYMVAQEMERDERLSKIPFLLLTAAPQMAGGITLQSPTPYRLSKPFKPDQLLSIIQTMLNG